MLITRDQARLLGKIAFMGLWQGRFAESENIFTALHMASPERIGPVLGLGMVLAHKGDYPAAIKFFEEKALPLDANDDHVKAWYALALYRNGQADKATPYLESVLATGTADDAKALAQGILDEMKTP